MISDPDAVFEDYKSRLIGRRISFRRLACEALLLYVDNEPGDGTGLTFWFWPIWHFCGRKGLIVHSDQIREVRDSNEAMETTSAPMEVLQGRAIKEVSIERLTFDLVVSFRGGYMVRTVASDTPKPESWHIRDNVTASRLCGSRRGLTIM